MVAGGGPVGLVTALMAARAGLDVLVREPRSGVIDKACGEGLLPGAVAALAGLGLHPDGHDIEGIRYLDGRRAAEARFRSGPGRGVRRTTLHTCLREAALDAGVVLEARAVKAVTQGRDRVLVDDTPARYLVAADGLHSPVRRHLGLDAPTRGPRRFGLRTHLAVAPWTSFVEVHWSAGAEAYVTPVADDQVGLAVLSGSPRPFAELLALFPGLAERAASVATTRVLGAGPLRQRSRRRTLGRVLLVGDAAGYVDALTGEGISVGLGQAQAAVDAVVADDPHGYEATWRRVSRRSNLLTSGLLTATRVGPARRALVPAAAALPGLFGTVVDQLARPA